jgi:acetyl-CoA carboxylase carboxyltransferase component
MKNGNLQFNKNEDANLLLMSEVRQRFEKIKLGGGKKNIAKQHEKGKMTARERVEYLFDKDTPQFEIGAFAGFEMYEEQGGCPAGGVIVIIGYVSGRQCLVVANDATVKAGAWFPITAKKNLRAQEISMENRLPIIYLVDRPGFFSPAMKFFRIKSISKNPSQQWVDEPMGISQIAAIMGRRRGLLTNYE